MNHSVVSPSDLFVRFLAEKCSSASARRRAVSVLRTIPRLEAQPREAPPELGEQVGAAS